jgi:hypothetical protein
VDQQQALEHVKEEEEEEETLGPLEVEVEEVNETEPLGLFLLCSVY